MAPVMNSRADRALSFTTDTFPIPTGREEDWRFTPLERLEGFFDGANGQEPEVRVSGDARYEIVPREDSRLGQVFPPEDRVSVIEWNAFKRAHALTIPADTQLENEVIVEIVATGSSQVSPLHIYCEAEAHSESTVVLTHYGQGQVNEAVEIVVGEGAHMTLVSVQEWDERAVHTSSHRIKLGKDATLKHIVVSLSGSLIRITSSVEYTAWRRC